MQSNRAASGGRIDRDRPLTFYFNGRALKGFNGDTLASALLANGVRLTARSFKYHRPRGIVGSGPEEPATLVELLEPHAAGNMPATLVPLVEGLRAKSVNCFPSPDFDIGAINSLAAGLIPAGFYYKTFKWPNWHLFEPSIRRAAGLAEAPKTAPAPGRYETRHAHCDVLVIGAGPAGLTAAMDAARTEQHVMLIDEQIEAGGSLLARRIDIGGKPGMDWVDQSLAELNARENVVHLQDTCAWAYREHNLIIANQIIAGPSGRAERSWHIRADHVVLATGGIERPLVFSGNDRPGVMLASAVRTYVNRYATLPGRKAVVFTNNDDAYGAAADMAEAGIEIVGIIDSRSSVPAEVKARASSAPVFENALIKTTRGRRSVTGVCVMSRDGGSERWLDCDLLAQSGGWNPTVQLWSQSRSGLRYDSDTAAFVPGDPVQALSAVGAANGDFTLAGYLPETTDTPYRVEAYWHEDTGASEGDAFVDLQNDVTVKDVKLALREGYDNIEHVKRYTTGGMGLDQGKTGNVNIIGVVSGVQERPMDAVGTTTFRSPVSPVSFGSVVGGREDALVFPYRHTPVTPWNKDQGAVMYEAGARWRRPGFFPKAGDTFQQSVNRECEAVRTGVGVYDGSPLGTFELKGRDTGLFLDFVFSNKMSSLKIGHIRYGLMLSDDGLILDDGVALRLGDHRWILSVSTGHADATYRHMEHLLQTEFPDWQVMITPVTSQWNNATVCGPLARDVLAKLDTDIDLAPDAFPFMSFREGQVSGIPARVARVSFTGELSFEINVARRHLGALWDKVMEAGAEFNILPVGSEASHVLRVEKGFLSLGHEVDGTVDPLDLGMGWVLSKKKPDFLGKHAIQIRRSSGAPRRELVGLLPDDPNEQIPEGAPLTPGGHKVATEGLVTACVWSVVQKRWVALALLTGGHSRHGETVHVRLLDKVITAQVTAPCFHDPDGELLRS